MGIPVIANRLVGQALETLSVTGAQELWQALDGAGAAHQRPVGDRWGNRGLFTAAGGMFDHKLVELATNMHDAVIASAMARRPGAEPLSELDHATLFSSPQAAVESLFANRSRSGLANEARIELHLAGAEGEHRRFRSIVFRDFGTGMSPAELPSALFRVGSSRKDGVLWQQGAFGRGGLTVLPNCAAWVVVTRKDPGLLGPHEVDQVTVAVVRWLRVGNRQTDTAVYQVTSRWESDGDVALPLAVPADDCDFTPGTHLCVVAFEAEGIWVSRLGDERSLDTLLDTRLFEPALPVSLVTPVLGARDERITVLRGLGRRLEDNPRSDRVEGREELPFMHDRATYRLPIRYFLFPAGDVGARRRFVARDHALIWNSNGQVHAHWTPPEFRHKTRLPKLADRILVVVDTDALPLPLRTGLFTADRTELLRNADAVRLEEELVAFLDDWDELWRANNDLIRDAIRRSNSERSTIVVARRISRALSVRGSGGRSSSADFERRRPERHVPAPRVLLDDPTEVIGPNEVTTPRGRTKGVYFSINGVDDFLPRRAEAHVACSHLDIDPDSDITLGRLRGGRLRVAIAVPPDAEVSDAELALEVPPWIGRQGGRKGPLRFACPFRVVDAAASGPGLREPPRGRPSASLDRVALVWTSHEAEEGWSPQTVGAVERIDAESLAQAAPDYAALAGQHFEVLVVKLNEEFSPLKAYASLRAKEVGDEGVARAKDRYAVGVGVNMLILDEQERERSEGHRPVDDSWIDTARSAAARGVLAVMPDYDQLVAEAGFEGV
jgi:hypothetical protein